MPTSPLPYAEINMKPYTNLVKASESRVKVSQRVSEFTSGSVGVVKLTPA